MRHVLLLMILGLVVACGDEKSDDTPAPKDPPNKNTGLADPDNTDPKNVSDTLENGQPKRVRVQHCLISFKDAEAFKAKPGRQRRSPSPRALKRTRAAAENLAKKLLSDAQGGWDFTAIVKRYSDDTGLNPADDVPGSYRLTNDGVTPDPTKGETARSGMVPGFSKTAFELKVGEIGLCVYDKDASPFGWHIMKRVE